jgi:hypothetical protein
MRRHDSRGRSIGGSTGGLPAACVRASQAVAQDQKAGAVLPVLKWTHFLTMPDHMLLGGVEEQTRFHGNVWVFIARTR